MPLFVTVTPGTTVTSSTTLDASTLNLLGTPSVDVTGTVDGGSITLGVQSVPLTSLYAQADQTIVGNGAGSIASPVALTTTDLVLTATTVNIKAAAVTEAKIGAGAVSYAKIQNVASARLLGNSTGTAGVVQELTVGSNLTLSAGALNALRPGVVFNNVESIANYTLPIVRSSAIELAALTTSITPQTATSKVLVQFSFSCEVVNTGSGAQIKQAFILERVVGATVTPLGVPSSPGASRIYGTKVMPYDGQNDTTQSNIVILFVDSPLTTSAVTYRLKAYTGSTSTQILYLNGTINQTDADYNTRATSQVILQEILP
jgi:hypothetical protein